MPLDIVVVMDPIASIHPKKDTTFALLLEGQRRGQLQVDTPDTCSST